MKANLYIDNNFDLFEGLWLEMAIWMSHGDAISSFDDKWDVLAKSDNNILASTKHKEKDFYDKTQEEKELLGMSMKESKKQKDERTPSENCKMI